MNRRSFLQTALGSLGLAATAKASPEPARSEAMHAHPIDWPEPSPASWPASPDVFTAEDLVRMPLPWSGRIVRQPTRIAGQKEKCCACNLDVEHPWAEVHDNRGGCPYGMGEPSWGRSPVVGSPERAYLEYMAAHYPHPENEHSDFHVLRRLESGELTPDDVYLRLVSAEEIDQPGSAYAGGRGEAYCSHITVLV